ncbi:MAG: HAMP domain-containing histidine kinase [Oscillospiraceae bacterium]|jgi:signal transduction histidine kinase|nr:HAMP domain-containing histidine kinase [Oscillospiraceae bacterium]
MKNSIARRLSRKMFWRLLSTFISIDVAICVLMSAAAVVYCEVKLADEVPFAISLSETSFDAEHDVTNNGVNYHLMGHAGGLYAYPPLSFAFPSATRGFSREVWGSFIPDWFSAVRANYSVNYSVYIPVPDGYILASVPLGGFLTLFCYAMTALVLFEIFKLFSKSRKNKRMFRRALDPISDLAKTAETLGRMGAEPVTHIPVSVGARLDRGDITELSGALAGIDALRLDKRIALDGTQKELRGLATAINDMLDRINESYIAQARFVSDASHELRTPISVIQGYANLLDRWGKNDEKTLNESIAAIKDEAENMRQLVEQLLFLARGSSNTIALTEETFDLGELAEEIAQETRMIDTGHTLEVKNPDAAIIFADRSLIKQAVRILMDNALKYTDAGGRITLATIADAGFAQISVTDTGIGISEDVLPRIFDRFVRAEESRARATGGAGLGLAIAKWIVARHGGHIEATSRVGLGTRITLILPSAAMTLALSAAPTEEPSVITPNSAV